MKVIEINHYYKQYKNFKNKINIMKMKNIKLQIDNKN